MQDPNAKDTSHVAAAKLAKLLERELNLTAGTINSVALRLFLKSHWSKVSKFAHDVHDGE